MANSKAFYEDKELSNKVLSIMKVIKKVSLKKNIGLSEDIVSISYNKAKNFPYDTRTSFQRDYESKKGKDERDIFGKSLIEMAERYKIDYKVVDEIYRKL
ncbi:ketopantoate reductase C-terminal domain-containing protein [Clostridium bornimense]|uniref:ketopantoate reductase C-terminal domain-containing protein n=1 Tax=Clostridium bornimense TaxID=1216932 RepID=UPI00138ADCD5|nr:ketopantoate reductase C-terminal domain-containing protein [Clostridium bornimense]